MLNRTRVFSLLLAFSALAALPRFAAAQQGPPEYQAKNTVYVEAGGNALIYSLNYERILFGGMTARAGAGVIPLGFPGVGDDGGAALLIIPLQLSYLFGSGNHHLEVGAGATFGTAGIDIGDLEGKENWSFATGTLGYRYQRPGGGTVFRAGIAPMFLPVLDVDVWPMVGISFGRSF